MFVPKMKIIDLYGYLKKLNYKNDQNYVCILLNLNIQKLFDKIVNNTRVKQGRVISVTLFLITTDQVKKNIENNASLIHWSIVNKIGDRRNHI